MALAAIVRSAATAKELTIWTINYSSDRQFAALEDVIFTFEDMNPGNPGVTVELVKRGTDVSRVVACRLGL